MTTIKTATLSTPAMRAVLPRSITPFDIAQRSGCAVLALADPVFVTGDAAVEAVANVATGMPAFAGADFVQATAINKPAMIFETPLGRKTLQFADNNRRMALELPVSYAAPFSFLSVFEMAVTPPNTGVLIGDESPTATQRANLGVTTSLRARMNVGGVVAQAGGTALAVGQWYAAIGTFNGTDLVSIVMPGRTTVTATVTTVPTGTTALQLSDASFGFVGLQDMAAFFTLDLLDAGNASYLADIWTMLSTYYPGLINGL